MSRVTDRLAAYFLPEGGAHDLEQRLYQGLCLVGAFLVFFVVIPVNSLQDLPIIISGAAVLFGILLLVLYQASRHGRQYPGLVFVALLVTLNVAWFPNAGSAGSIAFYFFPSLTYAVVFFRNRRRWVMTGIVFANYAVLLWIERLRPELATPFQHAVDRPLDLGTGFLGSGAAIVLMLWVVLSLYHRDSDRLRRALRAEADAREQVAESGAVLSTLINSTGDLIWLVDPETHAVTQFNQAVADRLARLHGTVLRPGDTPEDALPGEGAARWHALYARAMREGPFTTEYVLDDGTVLLLALAPAVHEGRTFGVSVFGRDITPLKRAEEERARIEQQLLQAQKMESLGSLAGGVAHDFDNMLSGIMGYADTLLEEESDAARREHLEAILRAAARSSDLTGKLLAFARRGKNIVEAVSLRRIVGEAVAMLRPSFHPALLLATELRDSWTVDGDPSQISQVVVNLCINASEAMPSGGTLVIRTMNRTLDADAAGALEIRPGDYVQVEVIDTGVGIADEARGRIFEPFFTTKAGGDAKGTGLGLSTVYGIVHLHQGAIAVDSTPGRGATFSVYLPKGSLAPGDRAETPDPEPGLGTVLVVEDEDLLRGFLVRALARLGYQTLTAEDGVEGLRMFREHRAALTGVILDLKMPNRGGRDTFLDMRAVDPSVPVLICSGDGDTEEAQDLITRGATALLPKPFRIADLAARLGRLRS
jgi:signal transduction histidine kinase/CheY-like chemotaxis protein